jgi:hypothetical protein
MCIYVSRFIEHLLLLASKGNAGRSTVDLLRCSLPCFVKPVLLNLGVSVLHFFIENPWVLAQIKVTISGKGTFLFNAGDLADCC